MRTPIQICTHIFDAHTDLARHCGSPALRGQLHCYYHHPDRRPSTPAARRRREAFYLTLPTNQRELQHALSQVILRLAANKLDTARASLLLYSLQIASQSMTS
jgi:hypothetical protein